ncbi:MAG: hypothetical protein ACI9DK_003026 [Vicingaceae bacterium]|jgi:hypothetical protein
MAKEKKVQDGFYKEHTVDITIKGKKHRVNKFEAKYLMDKIVAWEKAAASKKA